MGRARDMLRTHIDCIFILLFLFGWGQNQENGNCDTGNMENVLQFCSGCNITGRTTVLSTENVSTKITNCTCHLTVTEPRFINITGNCPTKIQHRFLGSSTFKNSCDNILQFMTVNQVLQFVYINNDNSGDSYCSHLQTNKDVLEVTCFAEPFTTAPVTGPIHTYMDSTLSTDHTQMNMNETTKPKGTTTKTITTETTKPTTSVPTITTTTATTKPPTQTITTETTNPIKTSDSTKTTHATTKKSTTIQPTATIKITVPINTTRIFDFIPNGSTTTDSTNEYQDVLQLLIIIILSVVAVVTTVIIIIVALCLRNKKLQKQEHERNAPLSSNPSFNQADDSGDEMIYNELYHSRQRQTVTPHSDNGNITPQNNINTDTPASNDSRHQADDSGDEMIYNELYHSRQIHSGHTVRAYSDYDNVTTSQSIINTNTSASNDSGRQRETGNSSFNKADDSGDEMIYNELYHSRQIHRGHTVTAYSDYDNVTPQSIINTNTTALNDNGSQSDIGNSVAFSTKKQNQTEVISNGEPVYAVSAKKKKQNRDDKVDSLMYSLPERKNEEKNQKATSEYDNFCFTDDKENSMYW